MATLFLTKESEPLHVEGKINIVLSPSFYWFKIEELPVKKASAAKALAPSLFDGVVCEGSYSYQAIKRDDVFWLFAYDDLHIAQAISDLGIKPSQIAHIYFAQSECLDLPEAIEVSASSALIAKDGAVSLIPLEYAGDTTSTQKYFTSHNFSKEYVHVNFFQNNFLDEKYIYRLMIVAIFFIGIYSAQYFFLKQDLAQESMKSMALNEKYNLPSTSFELRGLKNSLESKQKRQIKLREDIKTLLHIPLKSGEYIQKIIIKEKKAHLEIHLSEPKRAEVIKRALSKTMKITKAKVIDSLFLVGVKYE